MNVLTSPISLLHCVDLKTTSVPPSGMPDHTYTFKDTNLENENSEMWHCSSPMIIDISDGMKNGKEPKDMNWNFQTDMWNIGQELCLSTEKHNGSKIKTEDMDISPVCDSNRTPLSQLTAKMTLCDSDHNYSQNAVSDIETNFTLETARVIDPDKGTDHSYACGDFCLTSIMVGADHCYSRSLEAIIALPPHKTKALAHVQPLAYTQWPDMRLTEHNYSSNQELNRVQSMESFVANMARSRSEHFDHSYSHSQTEIKQEPGTHKSKICTSR